MQFKPDGEWREAVLTSLLTLKALTHHATGGIVAAGTTSLPEKIGGSRNWDYRYCWLRDATFTLYAFIGAGFLAEARAWREWLIRAVGGSPDQLQIMYGVAGERGSRNTKCRGCRVMRVRRRCASAMPRPNSCSSMSMAKCWMPCTSRARRGLQPNNASWALECALVGHLETIWDKPDDGIWEVRGGRKQFTHSKGHGVGGLRSGGAISRGIRLEGPRRCAGARFATRIHRGLRARIRYCTKLLRAVLWQYCARCEPAAVPLVGFLPAARSAHPRHGRRDRAQSLCAMAWCCATRAIREPRDCRPARAPFSPAASGSLTTTSCRDGSRRRARLFERLLSLRNDVGLLAEEYDPRPSASWAISRRRFSHLALINTARNLTGSGPAHDRAFRPEHDGPSS